MFLQLRRELESKRARLVEARRSTETYAVRESDCELALRHLSEVEEMVKATKYASVKVKVEETGCVT